MRRNLLGKGVVEGTNQGIDIADEPDGPHGGWWQMTLHVDPKCAGNYSSYSEFTCLLA
jgi:hypothetical protein